MKAFCRFLGAAIFLQIVIVGIVCAEDSNGFVALFDGKTLDGWVQRGGAVKFFVEDGVIVGQSVPKVESGFLCTKKNYGDFILELDYKDDPDLNSGVQFRSECLDKPITLKSGGKEIKIAAGRVHGYQCEIDMQDKRQRWWSAGVYDEARRGWLYPGVLGGDGKKFTAQGEKISKPNEWNHLRIEAVGDSIKTWLNGVARAGFKDSMTARGFIALQVHNVGNVKDPLRVRFRNIRIKEICAKDKETGR
ncbi:MAG: 3-keto-disaccharide hydrolase [Thermoguttaceae bacterium]